MSQPSQDDATSTASTAETQAILWAEEVADLLSQGLITPAEAAGINEEELEVVALCCEQALEVGALAEATHLAQGLRTLAPYLAWGHSLCAQTYRRAGMADEAQLAESIAMRLADRQTPNRQQPRALPVPVVEPISQTGDAPSSINDVLEPWFEPLPAPSSEPKDIFTLHDGRPLPLPAALRLKAEELALYADPTSSPRHTVQTQDEVTEPAAANVKEQTKTMRQPYPARLCLLEEQTTVTAVVMRRRGLDLTPQQKP